jgi:uncharacterized protein (TIGR00369 family)
MNMMTLATTVLAAQPFNDQVGARINACGAGEAVLEVEIADHHRQQFGLVHGGVLAYLADNSITFAAGSVLGSSVVTSGFSISYLRGSRNGTLRAHAKVVHHTPTLAVARVEITCETEAETRLCAVAQGTIVATAARS